MEGNSMVVAGNALSNYLSRIDEQDQIVGRQYGYYTVLKKAGRNRYYQQRYEVRCECCKQIFIRTLNRIKQAEGEEVCRHTKRANRPATAPHPCALCGQITTNLKYCSNTCKTTDINMRTKTKPPKLCLLCGKPTPNRNSNLSVIHADETVVQVLKEDGKAATSESRMWVYANNDRSGKPIRYFEYQPDRSGKHAAAFLKGFSGCLVTDGYAGYNQVDGVIRCGCWSHMRRYWREAMPKGATKETSKAAWGYDYCNKLFALEKKFSKMSDVIRKTARQVEAEPLLEAYWWWLETLDPAPGSKLADAVTYAKNQKKFLNAFLEYGEVDISNNLAENAIRPFVQGRKAWLFCDTPKGADSSAIVYSIVETAKANGLDPYTYLKLLLTELPYLGKNPASDKLDLFMPWTAAIRKNCILPTKKISPEDL